MLIRLPGCWTCMIPHRHLHTCVLYPCSSSPRQKECIRATCKNRIQTPYQQKNIDKSRTRTCAPEGN